MLKAYRVRVYGVRFVGFHFHVRSFVSEALCKFKVSALKVGLQDSGLFSCSNIRRARRA